MGMKHNYSCGSLAAAEQLEALMRHAAPPGGLPGCGMMLGSEQQGIMNQKLRQQFGGSAPMQNFLGSCNSFFEIEPFPCQNRRDR